MVKQDSPDHAGKPHQERARPPDALAVGAGVARSWVVVTGLVVVVLGSAWLGLRALRERAAHEAVASLEPVAPRVPAEPPERRQALEVADRLLRDYPDRPEALYVRGILLSRYGFNDEAVRTWEACLGRFPDLAPVYERLGLDAVARGENERAVALLRKAQALDAESAAAGLYLGQALNSLGQMGEAVPVLEQFLQRWPQSAAAHFQLGHAHLYLQDFARARDSYQAALRRDPQYAQAYYGLAVACGRLGDADQSRQYREQYAELIDRGRTVEHRRVRQGHDDRELQEALARAYLTAATIYEDDGRRDEAQEFRRRAEAITQGRPAAELSSPAGTRPAGRPPATER